MNPRRYQQVCDLFSNLVKRSPETRKSALDRVCADDADLRREVEALLAADADPLRLESFPALDLGAGLQDGAQTKRPPVSPPPMPDHIGHYSIRRVIGRGGMGVVYEAIQEHPHRTVALKVLRRGIASLSTLRRFEYESQILARLRHPHIAQVYEAGTHNEGTDTVPYFAMEYIPNAMTLLQYAAEKKLDHRQRLELFIKVCDAVHHGHQKGIIHRDLKPENILVDSAGEPKIIDFGVARATDSDMAITTLHTDVGQLIGTLQYMSPEQCEADPHDLDSRSDVYALGVVLYELLCGQLPYDLSGAPIPEAVRMIRERTPTRPSTIVRRLRGDMETIVLKALAKERDRRYRSAAQLADDIRHYLNDEPIRARPPSTIYQLRKFAKRNKGLVGGVAVALLALLAGTTISTSLYLSSSHRAEQLRRTAYFQNIALAHNAYEQENALELQDLLDACPPDLRGWEWRYLRRLSDTSLMTLRGHTDRVYGLDVSPDSMIIASGSMDNTIRLWDAHGGALLRVLTGHQGWTGFVTFSPDGSQLLATGEDPNNARIWDITTGEILGVLTGHKNLVTSGVYSPDGTRIATGSFDKTIKIWNAQGGQEIRSLSGHQQFISSIDWSPDGKRLVSGSWDGVIKLWNAQEGTEIMNLPPQANDPNRDVRIASLAFSPDGTRFVSASWDCTVRVWDAGTGELLHTDDLGATLVHAASFSPNGQRLAVSTGTGARIWDPLSGQADAVRLGHRSGLGRLKWYPNGSRIVTGSIDKTVKVWDARPYEEPGVLRGHTDKIVAVAVSPDGRRVFSAARDGTIRVWDVSSRKEVMKIEGHDGMVTAMALSHDGRRIVSGGTDQTVRIWDAQTGELKSTHTDHGARIGCVAYSPDDRLIVSGSWDKKIMLWDAQQDRLLRTLLGHENRVESVSFSPDGKRILSSSEDRTVRTWDVQNGREVRILEHAGPMDRAVFSPNGKLIALASSTVLLWDADTGEQLHSMEGHQTIVSGVIFSPDGRRLVSCALDSRIRIWEPSSGRQVLSLRNFSPHAMAFSPDGSWFVCSSSDLTLKIWDAGP